MAKLRVLKAPSRLAGTTLRKAAAVTGRIVRKTGERCAYLLLDKPDSKVKVTTSLPAAMVRMLLGLDPEKLPAWWKHGDGVAWSRREEIDVSVQISVDVFE